LSSLLRKVLHSILYRLTLDSIKHYVPENFKIAALEFLLDNLAFYSFDKAIELLSLIPPEHEPEKMIGEYLSKNLYSHIIFNYDLTFEPLLQKIEALANEEQKLKIMSSFLLAVIHREVHETYNAEKDFELTEPKRIFDSLKDSILLLSNIDLAKIYFGLSLCVISKNVLLSRDYFLQAEVLLNIENLPLLIANNQGEFNREHIWNEPVNFLYDCEFILNLACYYIHFEREDKAIQCLEKIPRNFLNFIFNTLDEIELPPVIKSRNLKIKLKLLLIKTENLIMMKEIAWIKKQQSSLKINSMC